MGQQRGGRSTSIIGGNPINPMAGPASFFSALGGRGVAAAVPKATAKPEIASTRSALGTPSLSGQESLGMNSIEQPFGGLRGGPSDTRRTTDFGTDIDLPGTTVGLTPGSEDKEEEDTITAPTINDEEKRREAAEKAAAWSS